MARSLIYVVLDSLRYDVAFEAHRKAGPKWPLSAAFGCPERRRTYATWTAPSHMALLQGLPPYPADYRGSTPGLYRECLDQWMKWMDRYLPGEELVPGLWVPDWLGKYGIQSGFLAAMPCIGPDTVFNRGWSVHKKIPHHDAWGEVEKEIRFDGGPWFWLVNLGETHYPYGANGLPRIPGIHGVAAGRISVGEIDPLNQDMMSLLKRAQYSQCVSAGFRLRELARTWPADAWVVVTSDHGELFGDVGAFGHGPVPPVPGVMVVPWWEGLAGALAGED